MALQIGDTAPDFQAQTTEGPISFHDWVGDSWAVLFSHPKDFTPVCTTELGYMAKIKPQFDERNVKVIGLSVDPVESHVKWEKDIEETQGQAVNFPMIGDSDRSIATLYDMIHPNANDTMTVRSVFIVDPNNKVACTEGPFDLAKQPEKLDVKIDCNKVPTARWLLGAAAAAGITASVVSGGPASAAR
jgi:alkyl hydroperoxide reductase subunit AhpC